MLRNTQIKIILTLLLIGTVIIGASGYINYANMETVLMEASLNSENAISILEQYQTSFKMITLGSILVFALVCVLVRCICY